MRKRSKIFIVSCLLVVVLATNYWLPSASKKIEPPLTPSSADYFVESVTIKRFDKNGVLNNQLYATKLEHHKDKAYSQIQAPQLLVKTEDKQSWKITATHGQLLHQHNQLSLFDSSLSLQAGLQETTEQAQTSIQAKQLIFELDANQAHSSSPVIITTSNTRTQADALRIDFKKQTASLGGQVTTQEVPNVAN